MTLKKPRVILVDDEPSITATLKIALRKEPWEVLTATSGESALQMLAEQSAAVVVSDERMPGMSGSEFLTQVAKRWPLSIRMMLTGQATLEDAMKAINDGGIWRFFLKPTSPTDLRLSIVKAIEHHELLTESARLLESARRQAAAAALGVPVASPAPVVAAAPRRGSIEEVERDESGCIVLDPPEAMDMQTLLAEMKKFNAQTS